LVENTKCIHIRKILYFWLILLRTNKIWLVNHLFNFLSPQYAAFFCKTYSCQSCNNSILTSIFHWLSFSILSPYFFNFFLFCMRIINRRSCIFSMNLSVLLIVLFYMLHNMCLLALWVKSSELKLGEAIGKLTNSNFIIQVWLAF